jgi:hypothetical protein
MLCISIIDFDPTPDQLEYEIDDSRHNRVSRAERKPSIINAKVFFHQDLRRGCLPKTNGRELVFLLDNRTRFQGLTGIFPDEQNEIIAFE